MQSLKPISPAVFERALSSAKNWQRRLDTNDPFCLLIGPDITHAAALPTIARARNGEEFLLAVLGAAYGGSPIISNEYLTRRSMFIELEELKGPQLAVLAQIIKDPTSIEGQASVDNFKDRRAFVKGHLPDLTAQNPAQLLLAALQLIQTRNPVPLSPFQQAVAVWEAQSPAMTQVIQISLERDLNRVSGDKPLSSNRDSCLLIAEASLQQQEFLSICEKFGIRAADSGTTLLLAVQAQVHRCEDISPELLDQTIRDLYWRKKITSAELGSIAHTLEYADTLINPAVAISEQRLRRYATITDWCDRLNCCIEESSNRSEQPQKRRRYSSLSELRFDPNDFIPDQPSDSNTYYGSTSARIHPSELRVTFEILARLHARQVIDYDSFVTTLKSAKVEIFRPCVVRVLHTALVEASKLQHRDTRWKATNERCANTLLKLFPLPKAKPNVWGGLRDA